MTDQPTAKLLIAEPPLQVLPTLAVHLGLQEALFVQQLHYMLIQPKLGKLINGIKHVRNTLEEWHEIFPFWAVNTIREIIGKLTDNKIVLVSVPSGRCKWYTLNYADLDAKIIKPARPLNRPNFGEAMKRHRKKAHDPELGSSMIQNLDASKTSSENPDNSSEGVPSSELAENVSTHLSAAPILNPAEREILRACNDGVVIAHYHNAEAANHLIELGIIERCQCGAKEVLCLKGKCPTRDKPCPDDVKVTELQTAIQVAFLSGSDGSVTETVVTPSPQTPLPPPAPAALPEVPEGYVVRWSVELFKVDYADAYVGGMMRHYIPIGKKQALCHKYPSFERPGDGWQYGRPQPQEQCPDCAAKAAARPATAKKAKPKKAAIYSDQHLFDLIAAFMNITGEAEIRANAPQIGKARKVLCDYILDKLKREPTADELPKIYERLEAVGPWYDKSCKGCDRPGWDKVTKWYIKYVQSLNGTAQAEGDSIWFDGAKGAYLKREKGIIYEQDPMNGEKWIPAK